MKVARRSKDISTLSVALGEALLPFKRTLLDGFCRGVVKSGELDVVNITRRRIRVHSEAFGLGGLDLTMYVSKYANTEYQATSAYVLVLGGGRDALKSVSNFLLHLFNLLVLVLGLGVELASALDVLCNRLLESGLLLLESDDSSLKVVLLKNLLVELLCNSIVRQVRIVLRQHVVVAVLKSVDAGLELSQVLGTGGALQERCDASARSKRAPISHTTHLLLNLIGENTCLLLDSGDMRLELGTDALKLADNGALDGVGKIGVLVGQNLGLVTDLIEDLLPSALAEELVTLMETAQIARIS